MRAAILAALSAACASVPLMAQAPAQPSPAAAEPAEAFDAAKGQAVVQKLAGELEDSFVFPQVGKAYAAMLRANLASGGYASFPSAQAFADKVTADLQAVHKDGHLKLHLVPPEARSGPEAERGGPPADLNGLARSGWLADGVAYLRFDLFPGNDITAAALQRFLDQHASAKVLIIDARAHRGGGLAEMDLLFPQLFDKPTHLVSMDTRLAVDEREGGTTRASQRQVTGPEGVVRREHWATPAAKRSALSKARVFLLTSKRTASAAEHLALSLKRTHRATLIGETTRGAGHYGGMIPLDEAFTYAAFIPVGRTFDPDTGEGWEAIGVKPDIEVAADRALDEALKRAGVQQSGEAALAALK